MAAADYMLCDRCSSKVVYDAEVDYNYLGDGEIMALCETCTHQGYTLVITKKEETCTKPESEDPDGSSSMHSTTRTASS